jgi:dolichol-phosphate mannosyltransferase
MQTVSFMTSAPPTLAQKLAGLRVAVVCPMANERDTALPFIEQVLGELACFKEVLFFAVLDKVSRDGTRDMLEAFAAKEPRLSVVWAPENRGVVDAYLRGYREALASGFEWVLEIDAGFSHPPQDVRGFLPYVAQDFDCVFGSRFCPGGQFLDTPRKRWLISRGGSLLSNLLLGTRLSDMTSGYQMFRMDVLAGLLERGIKSRGPFFQTEMKAYCRKLKWAEAPIRYRGGNHTMGGQALGDAFANLFALFKERLGGRL